VISEKLLAFTLLGAGWVLWLLLALSVLSVAVMVERALYFGSRRMSKLFPAPARAVPEGRPEGRRRSRDQRLDGGGGGSSRGRRDGGGNPAVEKAVQSIIDRRRLEYEKWLFVLGTLGTTRRSSVSSARCSASSAPSRTWRSRTRAAEEHHRLVRDGGHLGGAGRDRGRAVRGHSRGARVQHLPAPAEARDRRSNALGNAIASGLHVKNGSK